MEDFNKKTEEKRNQNKTSDRRQDCIGFIPDIQKNGQSSDRNNREGKSIEFRINVKSRKIQNPEQKSDRPKRPVTRFFEHSVKFILTRQSEKDNQNRSRRSFEKIKKPADGEPEKEGAESAFDHGMEREGLGDICLICSPVRPKRRSRER